MDLWKEFKIVFNDNSNDLKSGRLELYNMQSESLKPLETKTKEGLNDQTYDCVQDAFDKK